MSNMELSNQLPPEKSFDKAARIAAQWWAEQLSAAPKLNNEEARTAGPVTALQDLSGGPTCTNPAKLAIFQNELVALLTERYNRAGWSKRYGVSTGVDSAPDEILSAALQHAMIKIRTRSLPRRSLTTVFCDRIEIQRGYGAPTQTIKVADVLSAEAERQAMSATLPKASGALPMLEVCERLRNLPRSIDPHIREYGLLLAERLQSKELRPMDFYREAFLIIFDLSQGVDGKPRRKIDSPLAKVPPTVLNELRDYITNLADQVCPAHFSQGVREFEQLIRGK